MMRALHSLTLSLIVLAAVRAYQPWEKPYYVLSPGDAYDMKTRRIEKLGTGAVPRGRGSSESKASEEPLHGQPGSTR